MEKNILLTIEYDGSEFFGWQRQPDRRTVQGHLEQTLSSLFKKDIVLNGTSRTDAGVHALGQRASFKADVNIPEDRLARVINNALFGREKGSFARPPVRITEAAEVPPDFHARFDAKGKRYVYRIRNGGDMDVFARNYLYYVDEPLDIEAMRSAAAALKGTHDFKSFEASGGTPRETTVRTIFDIGIGPSYRSEGIANGADGANGTDNGGNRGHTARSAGRCPADIELSVSGDGFLYNMVRIITGTLVDIGTGKIAPNAMEDILMSADRSAAGHTAPPYGLYLAEVFY